MNMVKHIVLWTLKEEEKGNIDAIAADLSQKFKALLGVVDGLTAIELGKDYKGNDYNLALYCEFTDRDAEAAYQTHPAHVAIKKIVGTLTCGRAAADYEV